MYFQGSSECIVCFMTIDTWYMHFDRVSHWSNSRWLFPNDHVTLVKLGLPPKYLFEFLLIGSYPAKVWTSDQRYFNVVDQRRNNVYPTLNQNPTLGFQCCTTSTQLWCTTLKPRWITSIRLLFNVAQKSFLRWYGIISTLFQRGFNVS